MNKTVITTCHVSLEVAQSKSNQITNYITMQLSVVSLMLWWLLYECILKISKWSPVVSKVKELACEIAI